MADESELRTSRTGLMTNEPVGARLRRAIEGLRRGANEPLPYGLRGRRAAQAAEVPTARGPLGSPESTDEATTAAAIERYRGRPMAGVGEGGTLQPGSGMAAPEPPDEAIAAMSRSRAERQRQAARPNTRMRPSEPRISEADRLNQAELDRIAVSRATPEPAPEPRRSFFRRTNETGEGAPSTGSFLEDIRGVGRSLGLKKGGKVKKMAKGGLVKGSSASRRADGIASRGKTKGRMV